MIEAISIEQYNELNQSFPVKCVYHAGYDAGFFSEYNNMVLAMLYCFKNKIRFTLYSHDAIFGVENGWTDYFLPFCPEEKPNRLHTILNRRSYPRKANIIRTGAIDLFKKSQGDILLTSDIWMPMREMSDNIRSDCRKIIDFTWRYNQKTGDEVRRLIRSLDMPPGYAGLHIRGGDKFKETDIKGIDVYMQKLISLSDTKHLFVLTDDYTAIEEIRKSYPGYTVYTLCEENERGYFHAEFKKVSPEQRRRQMTKLFASVDILAASGLFIGTYSSNPGMYLGMRMPEEKMFGIDLSEWTIW